MVKQIQINLSNKMFYTFILIGILIMLGWAVFAYGGNNPPVIGHSAGEIEEADPTVIASVKDGVDWGEVSGIPAGFADGVDDVGIGTPGTWCGFRLSWGGLVFTCNGHDPMTSCPSGYSSKHFANMGDHGGNWYTCIKQ